MYTFSVLPPRLSVNDERLPLRHAKKYCMVRSHSNTSMYTKEKNNIDKSLQPDKNDSWCDARHPSRLPRRYIRTNTPQRGRG